MNIDIRTLTVVLSITAIIQIAAILMQYLANRTYKGIGWWLAGYISIAASAACLPLREISFLEKPAIMTANVFQISGAIALYTGINVFFNKKQNRLMILLFSIFYLTSISYFTFADNNLINRIIINAFSMAAAAFLISGTLIANKYPSVIISAVFLSAVFFIQGILFLSRGTVVVLHPLNYNFFSPSLIHVVFFMATLININLWMSGFIIMINQRLNGDNAETREHFEMIFNTSPDAAIISRMENGLITNVNEGFIVLSGLTLKEVIGKTTAEVGIWVNPSDRDRIRDELSRKGIYENIEIAFMTKNGKTLSGLVSAKVISFHGIPHVISIMRDITIRKKIEDKLIRAIDEIIIQREHAEKAGREKELLLREVHHRIKNNMNTIVGLLTIQSDSLKEPSASAALQDAGSRVKSMMMLYDKLYRSEGFQEISIREYLSPLVDEIAGSFPESRSVRTVKEIDDFMINAETLFSLGIIVNELITNIMKYAFKGIQDKVMTVTASLEDSHVCVVIQDNGNGLPESINPDNSTGFGLQLVGMLTKQIGGKMNISRDNGTMFILEFDL